MEERLDTTQWPEQLRLQFEELAKKKAMPDHKITTEEREAAALAVRGMHVTERRKA